MEKWANKNIMKLNKNKCKVLNLGSIVQGCSSGWDLPSWRTAPAPLEVQVGSKFNVSDRGAAMAKNADGMLSRDKEIIAPLYSALDRPCLEYCVQFWSPLHTKRYEQVGEGPRR